MLDIAVCNRLSERRIALGRACRIGAFRPAAVAQHAAKVAIDFVDRKQVGAGVDGAELLDLAVAPGGEKAERQFIDRNLAGDVGRTGVGRGRFARPAGGFVDIEA